ncbi:MAG: SGNH/GDSL hydrolase family protein [Clostridia bacterium]|nr:SGNH/GDSL hydrolase family protein [Clostridia bacterium]
MRILFQGDSITDAGRSRENDSNTGIGYPTLVKAALGFESPDKFEFLNRGISGNRVIDLYARIKSDIINLNPDVMSILIGVNDVWHEYMNDAKNGVDAEKYFKIYSMLIEEVKKALPEIKIMILEPFTLKGTGNEAYWDIFKAEVEKRAEMAEKLAKSFNLTFIPLQSKFDDAVKLAPAEYWLADGVHPTAMGHELIKREWITAFKSL